jgi:hypothetical protein
MWFETRALDLEDRLRVENRFVRGMASAAEVVLGPKSLLWDSATNVLSARLVTRKDKDEASGVHVALCKLIATNRPVFGHKPEQCPFQVVEPVGRVLLERSYKAASVKVCA